MATKVKKDIILFYYYSSPTLPDSCFLKLSKDIAYRNLFLLNCSEARVHFEFPMFEDNSYNTICNHSGVTSLIKRPNTNEKYILFRTKDKITGDGNIMGYYKLKKAYYQETEMFNNNGFVWGIEAGDVHLIKRGSIIYKNNTIYNTRLGRSSPTSWGDNKNWPKILNRLIYNIKKKPNLSKVYQKETNRLVSLFKDKTKMEQWKLYCQTCKDNKNCPLYKCFRNYNRKNNNDMFTVINKIYNSNIYSRNVLNNIPKNYLR